MAAFQLYEINQRQKKEEKSLKILLDLHEKIRNGVWILKLPTYDFFVAEIESILNSKFNEGKFPEIQESFQTLQKQQSPYRQKLVFSDFLKREAIPKIKEKLTLSRMVGEVQSDRLLTTLGEDLCLVSYTNLPNFQTKKTFYGGFYWDLDSLKKEIFPKVLGEITKDSNLHFQIIDERGRNI